MTSPTNKSTDSSNGTNKTTHTNERYNNTTTYHRNRQRLLPGEGRRNRHAHHEDSKSNYYRCLHTMRPGPTLPRTLIRRRSMLPFRRLQPQQIHLCSPKKQTKSPAHETYSTSTANFPTNNYISATAPRNRRTPHLSRRLVQIRNQPIRHRRRRLRRTHHQ